MRPLTWSSRASRGWAGAGAVVALLLLAGCGTDETAAAMAEPAAPTTGKSAALVCAKDAKPVGLPDSFPRQASVPAGYVVTDVESRTGGRIVVTAVAPKPFKQTLAEMQAAYSTRGWTPSDGEVEARDAESNFSRQQLRGRWAIREMPECPDNTAVSLLIGK
ncbi:MAG TPA: hypothetical protein VGN19_09940 [Pedococcus sp.]|nr:hypothetical protein [Pedococcus sp.]